MWCNFVVWIKWSIFVSLHPIYYSSRTPQMKSILSFLKTNLICWDPLMRKTPTPLESLVQLGNFLDILCGKTWMTLLWLNIKYRTQTPPYDQSTHFHHEWRVLTVPDFHWPPPPLYFPQHAQTSHDPSVHTRLSVRIISGMWQCLVTLYTQTCELFLNEVIRLLSYASVWAHTIRNDDGDLNVSFCR